MATVIGLKSCPICGAGERSRRSESFPDGAKDRIYTCVKNHEWRERIKGAEEKPQAKIVIDPVTGMVVEQEQNSD